jgi:PmbA protein
VAETPANPLAIAEQVVDRARKAGADEAEVFLLTGRDFEVTLRNGQIEVLKEALSRGLGLRALTDHRLGFSHTNDFDPSSLRRLADQTVGMAKYATQDEFHGLPDGAYREGASLVKSLQIVDPHLEDFTTEKKISIAREMEEAALAFDFRVTTVEGSTVSDGEEEVTLVNSKGFSSSYKASSSSLVCAVIAEEHEKRQVNYWYSSRRLFSDHESPSDVGRKAAERTVRSLSARKVPSGKFPVVFEPLVAASFLGSIAGALNGESVFRRLSFLSDRVGQKIGSDILTIIDDGRVPRGLASRPFDGEGVATGRKALIEGGILRSYLYDSYTARKIKGASTGNASRSYASTPHINPLNFYIPNGTTPPTEILGSVQDGFLVTGMIGFGVDIVTGQFSRGASGIWIRNGKPEFPVHEVTVASTMQEMLQNIEMIGDDLVFNGSVSSPTLKFTSMTISGT